MKKINIHLIREIDDSYPVYIGNDIFKEKILQLIEEISPSQIAIITDTNINKLYIDFLNESLNLYKPVIMTFEAGEGRKNISTILNLFSCLAESHFDRKSLIIGFGGGVTGDMAGFLASIYMRGIPFIQVPTSLLSAVDSSIGGKTGVDTECGKNLMGTFYQPKSVIIDTCFLKTLPQDEFFNGMAEIIKTSIISDRKFFNFIYKNSPRIINQENEILVNMIYQCCKFKGYIVENDEKEHGLRQVLNFGHTAGHAIEHASNYTIPHGFAVAIGMIIESFIAVNKKVLNQNYLNLITDIIKLYSLDQYKETLRFLDHQKILNSVLQDKKNISGNIKIVMIEKVGSVYQENNKFSFIVTMDEFISGLNQSINLILKA